MHQKPGGHSRHSSAAFRPVLLPYVPSLQLMPDVEPLGQYLPLGHGAEHWPLVCLLRVPTRPGSHRTGSVVISPQKEPLGQLRHC